MPHVFIGLCSFDRCSGTTFVDSTMIPVCENLRRYANKVFAGVAADEGNDGMVTRLQTALPLQRQGRNPDLRPYSGQRRTGIGVCGACCRRTSLERNSPTGDTFSKGFSRRCSTMAYTCPRTEVKHEKQAPANA